MSLEASGCDIRFEINALPDAAPGLDSLLLYPHSEWLNHLRWSLTLYAHEPPPFEFYLREDTKTHYPHGAFA